MDGGDNGGSNGDYNNDNKTMVMMLLAMKTSARMVLETTIEMAMEAIGKWTKWQHATWTVLAMITRW